MSHEKPQEGVNFNKSSPLLKDLFKQKTVGFLCDVELRLQDNIIQVHGCVLASQSEYFLERFSPQNSKGSFWDKHWCAVRPLVIDLDSEMDIDEHCFTCLSQVIDYVYLKELFVKEGHSLHSLKYASFLKIPELLALCKTYEKNLSLEDNKVKSGRISQPIKKSRKECLTQRDVSQANTYTEEKCEFICCSEDFEPSVKKYKDTNKRSIACELCDFNTDSIKMMRKHAESLNHYGTRCPICRLQIPNEAQLKDHLMLHEGAKPYICHICNKRTRFWVYHKEHLRVHCRNKPFFCSICQTRFKEEKNLVVHMKSHGESYYSCKHCTFVTSEFNILKAHLVQHSARLIESNERTDSLCSESIATNKAVNASYYQKKFICQACGKGFSLQKNLKRHVLLKHFSESQDLKCPKCNYLAKRLDMLKNHLIKRHRHLEPIEIEQILKGYRNCRTVKRNKIIQNCNENSEILGVLIPVQLVSTSDKTTLNAFAVKTNETLEDSVCPHENDNPPIAFNSEELINSIEVSCDSLYQNSTPEEFHAKQSCEKHMKTNFQFSTLPLIASERTNECLFDLKRPREDNKATGDRGFVGEEQQVSYTLSEEASGVGTTDEIWLNESTGELLSGSGYVNLHLLHSEGSIRKDISSLRKANLDVDDAFKTLLLNDQSGEISVHDITEAKEDYFSNPQTPQTNVFDIDDTENLISWNCLESPFCSTWVLNEATGELNMVRFSVKSLDNNDKLGFNKSSDGLSPLDDDDTALFLNEGTGDLSVIYFNPNDSRGEFSDIIGQDTLETMSDHSDDEDIDFLNEELRRVSANFMGDDGNEKFLNELTGEFDVASFSRFQTDVMAYQTPDNSMVYLNEETGEISWNVMDQDANSDIVTTNSDILNLDFDDSMNCEELDNFPTKTDFSSEFCMVNSTSSDWQNLNETCDTLLNECTGELVQKMI